jgi:hypothetical protein
MCFHAFICLVVLVDGFPSLLFFYMHDLFNYSNPSSIIEEKTKANKTKLELEG